MGDGVGEQLGEQSGKQILFYGEAWRPELLLSGHKGLGIRHVFDGFGVGRKIEDFGFKVNLASHRFGSQDGSKWKLFLSVANATDKW